MNSKDVMAESCAATSDQAAELFLKELQEGQCEERLWVLPLDANGKVLVKPILVSVGNEDGTTTINPAAIFRAALKADAEEIIVAHNHPSGDLRPSKADVEATAELSDLATRLELILLDHLILGGDKFFSFAENGLLDASIQ